MPFKLESRWSKRGIRKCPKCGTSNGHRAVQCKNKQCRQILNTAAAAAAAAAGHSGKIIDTCDQLVGVQLQSGLQEQSAKLYSVRKLNGAREDRGFVEIRDCVDGADEQLELKTGICYVDCEPHTDLEGTCQHVRVAAATSEMAEALPIRKEVLQRLNATNVERVGIWKHQMNSGEDDPLVQRISFDTFVVKCYDDDPHQLVPYCHVELKLPSSIICDCQSPDMVHQKTVAAAVLSSPQYQSVYEDIVKQLLLPPSSQFCDNSLGLLQNELSPDDCPNLESTDQFLVTIVDDPSMLTNSNMQLISCRLQFEADLATADFDEPCKKENVSNSPVIELINSTENSISAAEAFAPCYDENLQLMDCQIELMDQFNLTDQIDFCPSDIELSDDNVVFPADEELGLAVQPAEEPSAVAESKQAPATATTTKMKKLKLLEVTTKKAALRQSSKIAKEKMKKGSYNVRRLMRVLESNGVVFNRLNKTEASAMAVVAAATSPAVAANPNGSLPSFEATLCNLTFTSWLESVIEQLNSVIHYDGDGQPATQIFSIHENFFQCLRARFSVGHRLRTPDHSVILMEGPRTGLTCHIYKFTCYKSLRNVLKTDKIAFQFEKSFCRTSAGTFQEIDLSDDAVTNHDQTAQNGKKTVAIKPFQYKTYIKMGTHRSDPSEKLHYFSIEWIPGVLPKCRFGELRVAFQYGHKENHLHVGPPTPKSADRDISASNELQQLQS
ncbi:uncharacterized protein C2orf42 homolog [Ochlerotatus camptorhynchus]|uniref:uncharacterized protein C2orf42 homolog n=1 Tax=Ochlerotatus camptorhynchus TaxID=644619 RepID=UPI0031E22BA8